MWEMYDINKAILQKELKVSQIRGGGLGGGFASRTSTS